MVLGLGEHRVSFTDYSGVDFFYSLFGFVIEKVAYGLWV